MIGKVVLAVVLVLLAQLRANAATELCAASVLRVVPIHATQAGAGLGTDTLFAFQLRADAPRQVSGVLNISSAGETYSLPFNGVALKELRKRWITNPSGVYVMDYLESESDPIYFKFAAPRKIDAAWVASAGAQQPVDCPAMPLVSRIPQDASWSAEGTGSVSESLIRAAAPIAAPTPVFKNKTDAGTCGVLYEAAKVNNVVAFPPPERAMDGEVRATIIKVVVGASGDAIETSIFGRSGDDALDRLASAGAQQSTYKPAHFLCLPIPSIYLFTSSVSPSQ